MKLHTRRRWWRRLAGPGPVALSGLVLATALLPLSALPAHAAGKATSADLGPQGFPLWYEDARGQRLDLCVDNLNCLNASVNLTPFAGGEAAYWSAAAELPALLAGDGRASLDLAVSAGFDPTTGDPVTFGRIRLRLRNLTPDASYTITHPYGVETLVTDGNGDFRSPAPDVGCVPPEVPDPLPGEPPPPPPPGVTNCDFGTALGSGVFDGFLRWDAGAPTGFLGDGVTPHAVVGSPTGNNFFEVTGPGVSARTTDFTVEGRFAAPVSATPVSRAFGDQKVGTTSTTRTISVLNTSGRDVTLDAPGLVGADAGQFTVLPPGIEGCTEGAVLADGATCTLGVAFSPTTAGFKRATVTLPNTGDTDNLVASVALSGTGAQPMLTLRRTLAVGDVGVGQARTTPLTVTSSGNVDLVISGVQRTGSPEFSVDAAACTNAPVKARRFCTVNVTYRPTRPGADIATLIVTHDAVGSPSRVSLTGRGVDVTAPTISRLRVRPGRFDPDARPARVTFGVDGPGQAIVRVAAGGRVLRALGPVRFAKAGRRTVRWDGLAKNRRPVAPGRYTVTVSARDGAGNTSSRSTRLVVVR